MGSDSTIEPAAVTDDPSGAQVVITAQKPPVQKHIEEERADEPTLAVRLWRWVTQQRNAATPSTPDDPSFLLETIRFGKVKPSPITGRTIREDLLAYKAYEIGDDPLTTAHAAFLALQDDKEIHAVHRTRYSKEDGFSNIRDP